MSFIATMHHCPSTAKHGGAAGNQYRYDSAGRPRRCYPLASRIPKVGIMRALSTTPPRTPSLKTRGPLPHSKVAFPIFVSTQGVLVCFLLTTLAAAQTAPTLTPTAPLPNNPTVQVNPVQPVPAQTICIEQYAPVCARISGVEITYSNRCFAEAAGAEVVADGPCPRSVVSPLPK
jgi:hypothetical protein